jgi:hypothetical protein
VASGASVAFSEELAATIARAAALGIPAWRIMTALGIALPVAAGDSASSPPGRTGTG